MLGNARPPQAQSSLGQSGTGFGQNMIPVLQGRPGGIAAASYHGAAAPGMTASSFMPGMQHQGQLAHSDAPQAPPLQPQGVHGPRFQGQFTQPFQFAPSVPQFQLQPSQQQQQRTAQPSQFVRSLSDSQTPSSQSGSGYGNLPCGGNSLTQNV